MNRLWLKVYLVAALSLACTYARGQHLHFVAGAQSPTSGAKLVAVNSNDFTADSGFVQTMILNTNGAYTGYYLANHSFVVAAVTPDHGGPEQGAPALGSWIHMGIDSISGPAGGQFGYWELGAMAPTITVPVGQTATNLWRISENDGSPGSDPYGHIHGRRFTATQPGLYLVGFRFVDLSTNGAASGPIHQPSNLVYVFFQAGITISAPNRTGNSFHLNVGTQSGRVHTLQWTTNLHPSTTWVDGPSIIGDNHLRTLIDDTATGQSRFYRVLTITSP